MGSAPETSKSEPAVQMQERAVRTAMAAVLPSAPAASASPPPQVLNPFLPFDRVAALRLLFVTAWVAILLGLAVQGAMLIAEAGSGASLKLVQALADIAGGLCWSAIVCCGVCLGTAAARHRQEVMGVLGLVSAPLAWAGAKAVQRGTAWMLGQPLESVGPLTYQAGIIKAAEYAVLGYLLARLIKRPSTRARDPALLGLAVGTVFGGAIVALTRFSTPGFGLPPAKLLALGVSELLFPIGCALVVSFVTRLADLRAATERILDRGS